MPRRCGNHQQSPKKTFAQRSTSGLWVGALLFPVGTALAQQAADQASPPPTSPPVQTLDEVRALPPDREEVLDLYKFRNPIQVAPNTFNKSWSPPPSPKEISENGGYLAYGVDKLVELAAKHFKGIPGIRRQIQPAIARPPPLSEAQMDRAAQMSIDNASPNANSAQ